ncbi:MqnA/MqnD/SBP family protein, partial [Calderihabitans maritimus]|uniref:MqnA/MqnD/SBP family protein n=1 Tax=Calderihabitans maritimus TaxID=1246530 RepID=UPI00192D12AD
MPAVVTRLGIVENLDFFPVIDALESAEKPVGVEIIKDTASRLTEKFLTGEVDIAPLPSVMYAHHMEKCVILPDLSLGAEGPAANLMLLSKVPVRYLGGRTVCLPDGAASSYALLRILLEHCFEITVNYIRVPYGLEKMLHFGDAALVYGYAALELKLNPPPGLHLL